jgi:hypothetical protein
VRLRTRPLGELVFAPLGYEFCWGHLNGILPVFAKNRELTWQLGLAISFEVANWGSPYGRGLLRSDSPLGGRFLLACLPVCCLYRRQHLARASNFEEPFSK